jgi:hypothetical protein
MSFVYPNLKQILEASTRRVTTTLTFREGTKEYSIDVVEWFTIPQAGLTTNDQLNAALNSATNTSTTGTTVSGTATSPKVSTPTPVSH